jgi:hypothetical protein
MSPSQAYCFLNNLANATNESSIKVRFARMWDNMNVRKQNEMISIDMVLIDEQASICMLFSKQKKIWFSVWCLIITY